VTSIERTAYPRFKRLLSARELHVFFTPQPDEVAWARSAAGPDEHVLALVVWLKCFGRLGYFPALETVPAAVVDHVRRDLGLAEEVAAVHSAARTAERHRDLVRRRFGVVLDPAGARKVAADAIREAAYARNHPPDHPPDLINIALERLVEGCFELPAFSTLDKMASRIRGKVNAEIFGGIAGRAGPAGVARLEALLDPAGPGGKTGFDRLKRSAPRPSWTNFRRQIVHLRWADDLGDAAGWVEGVAASKLADFAGEADAADAAVMRDYGGAKKVALLAALVSTAQGKARDDVAEMFCRRVATLTKRARAELEALREAHRAMTERLIANYRAVLERIDPADPAGAQHQAALEAARKAVLEAGGFAGQYADIDRVSAHHADNHAPLVARHFRNDRAAMLAMVGTLDLQATSVDRSVLEALDFVREHATLTRDHISDQVRGTGADGQPVTRVLDMSFASEDWRRAIRDRKHPGTFVRRHLEACVLTYLAEELRTGDIAVAGAQAYANWADQLLSPAECGQLLPGFCAEAGLPADGAGFRADLQGRLSAQCADCDGGYPDNADLVIDDQGVPSLKRYRAAPPAPTALALEAAIAERMPERTLLGIVARTGHWLEWWRRFSPASGSDPKLADAFFRYTLTTFAYGSNLGPAQAARHMAGVSAHELGVTARRHATIGKLNLAIADVVDAFSELDLARAWATGRRWPPTAPRWRRSSTTCWPRRRSGTGERAGSRTTTSPTPTSRCSQGSSRSGYGRRSTSSRACCSRSRRSGRARSTPTRRASRSRCSRSRTCSDST
jgi:hypothetical protein